MGPFLGSCCQGPGTHFKAASLLKKKLYTTCFQERIKVAHSKRHTQTSKPRCKVRNMSRASTQLFGTNIASITAPWIPSWDWPFPYPSWSSRAVHSGNLNWIAVQGHGGEKWWWIQQARGWCQQGPGQLIASDSINGSGQKGGLVQKAFPVCFGPMWERSFPLCSGSCVRKHFDKKATWHLSQDSKARCPNQSQGRRPSSHLASWGQPASNDSCS